jgi:hypothetical protein
MTPAEIAARLTAAERRALLWLPRDPAWITAADLGERMGGTARMKAQGLGRLGGTMAWRLMRKGLAALVPMRGTSGYRLTPLGLQVRAIIEKEDGK